MRSPFALVRDLRQHRLDIFLDLMILKPQNLNPTCEHPRIASGIPFDTFGMRRAVEFDHQSNRGAPEVGHVRTNRVLASELESLLTARTQAIPHRLFDTVHAATQLPSPLDVVGSHMVYLARTLALSLEPDGTEPNVPCRQARTKRNCCSVFKRVWLLLPVGRDEERSMRNTTLNPHPSPLPGNESHEPRSTAPGRGDRTRGALQCCFAGLVPSPRRAM